MDSDDDWEKQAEAEEEEERWAGEDEDDDVGSDWDAEPKVVEKKVEVNKPKKLSAKQLAKKQAELERDSKRRSAAMTEEERLAEKLRQEAAIQKSNENLIDDLFGEAEFGGDEDDGPAVDGFDRDVIKQKANEDLFGGSDDEDPEEEEKEEPAMKAFPVTTEKEVEEFATFVSEKIKKAKATKLMIHFLKQVLKQSTADFKMDDVKLVQKELTQIYNVKRVEHNQKKHKKKKPTLKMGRGRANDDMFGGDDDYGDGDDFF
mmetsp:Transcript_7217/g.13411  ORF Transcript_7217/g.13411 Transcript_7217/m.13411 type:complete len:260 (-) Transcript_7217:253-1032(-)